MTIEKVDVVSELLSGGLGGGVFMKVTFICGYCGAKSDKLPKTNRSGDKVLCHSCFMWQCYDGILRGAQS